MSLGDRISREEFRQLQEPWDPKMKAIADERMLTSYRRERLEHFSEDEAQVMAAALDRLIPQSEGVDLVGFFDARIADPLGRGDRQPGMPDELKLLKQGLAALDETARALHTRHFKDLSGEEQDEILVLVQRDEAPEHLWEQVPGSTFFERFYYRALAGYFAHPRAWMRIGFYGASYPEGYVWTGRAQVKQRHERQAGWDRM